MTSQTPNPPDYTAAATALSEQATRVSQWAEEHGLALSAPKSTVTLFTSEKRQSNATPQIILNNSTLPLERHPRILRITLDPYFTFGPPINNLVSRITPRLNILIALAGTNWGEQKKR